MRRALVGSLLFHAVVTVLVFQWVAFRQVKYIPRDVYSVKLVAAGAARTASAPPAPVEAPPKPEPVVEPKEDKDDRMPPPPDDTKKKPPQKKPEKKRDDTVPSTDARKTDARADSLRAGTGTGTGAGDATATGDVSLDGVDFPFASYISRMRQKVASAWVPAGSAGEERKATIYFRVHRDGRVSDVSVEQSSGVALFDRSCQRAVLEAAPLPPLPREYMGEYLGVHFPFVSQPVQ